MNHHHSWRRSVAQRWIFFPLCLLAVASLLACWPGVDSKRSLYLEPAATVESGRAHGAATTSRTSQPVMAKGIRSEACLVLHNSGKVCRSTECWLLQSFQFCKLRPARKYAERIADRCGCTDQRNYFGST